MYFHSDAKQSLWERSEVEVEESVLCLVLEKEITSFQR